MGVRGLEYYLVRSDLIKKDPISELKGIRLGIDGTFWLRRLLTLKDPFHIALGKVVPGQLMQQIQRDLSFYDSLQIQPIFVFPSLPVLRTELPYPMSDDASNMRNQGWEQYFSGEVNAAQYSFESSKSFSLPELASHVISFLISHNIIVIRAPFASIPQLLYFKQQGIIHAIMASNEIICYEVDKWITVLYKSEFHWINRQQVLKAVKLQSQQMLDVCLLCGIDSPTFPPIIPDRTQSHYSVFESAISQIQMSGNGYTAISMAIQSSQQNLNNYLSMYIRYYVFWFFNPCYTTHGLRPIHHILQHSSEHTIVHPLPRNVHLIFGPKLKQSLYCSLVYSLLNPHLLFQLTSGIVLESPPLCNGSWEYRKCLQLLHIHRGFVFDVLKQCLGGLKTPTHLYFWHDPKTPYLIKSQNTSYKHPMLNTADCTFQLQQMGSTTWQFTGQHQIGLHVILTNKPQTTTATTLHATAVINNAHYRLLCLLGYGVETPFNRLLTMAITPTTSREVLEGLFLCIELIRLELMHGMDYHDIYPIKPDDTIRPHIQLITRVCSCITMQHKDVIWPGPLNRNMLQFNSILKLVMKSIKQWNEVILIDYLQQMPCVDMRELTKWMPDMLFNQRDYNCSMGVFMSCWLLGDGGLESVSGFKALTVVERELARGLGFWELVMGVVMAGDGKWMADGVMAQFKKADEWLKRFKTRK